MKDNVLWSIGDAFFQFGLLMTLCGIIAALCDIAAALRVTAQ